MQTITMECRLPDRGHCLFSWPRSTNLFVNHPPFNTFPEIFSLTLLLFLPSHRYLISRLSFSTFSETFRLNLINHSPDLSFNYPLFSFRHILSLTELLFLPSLSSFSNRFKKLSFFIFYSFFNSFFSSAHEPFISHAVPTKHFKSLFCSYLPTSPSQPPSPHLLVQEVISQVNRTY